MLHIGVDEAGYGPLLGPLVIGVAAFRVEPLADAVAALELYLTGCRDGQSDGLHLVKVMHDRLNGLAEAAADGAVVRGHAVRQLRGATARDRRTIGGAGDRVLQGPLCQARGFTRWHREDRVAAQPGG